MNEMITSHWNTNGYRITAIYIFYEMEFQDNQDNLPSCISLKGYG